MKNKSIAVCVLVSCLLGMTSCGKESQCMMLNHPYNIRGVVSYKRNFGDEAAVHLNVSKKAGVRPIEASTSIMRLGGRVQEVKPTKCYQIDSLVNSIPYLTPKAKTLLDELSANFLDSLKAKGLNANEVMVTRMFQTTSNAERLQLGNSKKQVLPPYCYGTTFDISGKRFYKVEGPDSCYVQDVHSDTLKLVLAEVLRDLKRAERCYIKYEFKEDCFQITAR